MKKGTILKRIEALVECNTGADDREPLTKGWEIAMSGYDLPCTD